LKLVPPSSSHFAETAGLLPAKFLSKTQKSSWDVRQNLFEHNLNHISAENELQRDARDLNSVYGDTEE